MIPSVPAVPATYSTAWWCGTAANLFACLIFRLPRWMSPLWLERLAEQVCIQHDWREDPIF